MPKKEPVKLSPQQEAFLTIYSQIMNISLAAKQLKISRNTVYYWLEKPDFTEAMERAEKEYPAYVEGLIRARAHKSDTLLIFLAKSIMPEKYSDRSRIDINVSIEFRRITQAVVQVLNDEMKNLCPSCDEVKQRIAARFAGMAERLEMRSRDVLDLTSAATDKPEPGPDSVQGDSAGPQENL
jgi:hypothetical protein